MSIWIEEKLSEIERILEMWSFFAKEEEFCNEWTEEDCRKQYGEVEIDGEKYLITNSAMQSVVELVKLIRKYSRDVEQQANRNRFELKDSRRETDYWRERACLSDSSISDLIFEYIEKAKGWEGDEGLQYTDIKLLEIARGRLK